MKRVKIVALAAVASTAVFLTGAVWRKVPEPVTATCAGVSAIAASNLAAIAIVGDIDSPDTMEYAGSYQIYGYDTCARCCGKTDGITASGTVATVGRTCASNDFPFGTVLYIDGIGERVVEDRGGMAHGVIDVLCEDHPACYAITGKYDVYIVREGESMQDIGFEPPLDPPEPPAQFCARCGDIAVYADSTGCYCADCAEYLANQKYLDMDAEGKAEWAGFERIVN